VTSAGLIGHLTQLQAIADANGGTRMAGSSGYDASVEYVASVLSAAGYTVTKQTFDIPYFEPVAREFRLTSPEPRTFVPFDFGTEKGDYTIITFSGSGVVSDTAVVGTNDITFPEEPIANSSDSGCEAEDFEDGSGNSLVAGKVALLQRGTCTYSVKTINAEAAGAVAVLVFNDGAPGRRKAISGALGEPDEVTIPVIGISYELGVELAKGASVSLALETISEVRPTSNVLAETPGGRSDHVIVVGAHLDSVAEGPGINDNGSGVATLLEIALQMQELRITPHNKVRFAFWSAEENGLLGSEHYVSNLSEQEREQIALYLNFDMVASLNYGYYVYDGSTMDTGGANAMDAGEIEQVFLDYFAEQSLTNRPTEFDDRSDHGPFMAADIPAGGLFSGAENEKSIEEQAAFGGEAGVAHDPCYHRPCDTLKNINEQVLDEMADAAAHAILTLSMIP
jgi:Zn-dependent M28 family amino/carboxypeptidase